VSDRLNAQLRAAAETLRGQDRPAGCQLGGSVRCGRPPELKVADAWGDAAWGCVPHVEQVILNESSVFIADANLGGLAAYLEC
jgi:hypothetical protein